MKRRYAYLMPFSHLFGAACLIPTTSYVVQAFPSKISIYDIEDRQKKEIKELHVPVKGPLHQFTLLQDLEAGCISYFSDIFRIHITPTLEFLPKRQKSFLKGERLCLGSYKQQEVEKLRNRFSLAELFPLLFRLGNQPNLPRSAECNSMFSLLEQCRKVEKPEQIHEVFRALFLSGFSPFFLPKQEDNERHNLYQPQEIHTPILALLSETAFWIRSLFFVSTETFFHFIPQLPPECVFGKMFDMETEWGKLDFEWSKKEMRTAKLCCEKDGLLELRLPSSIRSYRLKQGTKEWRIQEGIVLELKKDTVYFFDRFEK